MKRLPVFFCAAALFLLLGVGESGCTRGPKQADSVQIAFTADDGFILSATLYLPRETQPPGLILVHRYGGSRHAWEYTAHSLRMRGVMVVALDLRGHGDSRTQGDATVDYRQLPDARWLDALPDIRLAKQHLLAHGADSENLAIAGEGLGASLALHYALDDPDMQAVVMLSPGLETRGVITEPAIRQLDDCPTLLMASEGDSYAAMSATALNTAAPVYSELRTWSGGAHGVDLFAAHPEAAGYLLQWLLGIIGSHTGS